MVQATVAIATILAYTTVVLALGYHGWRVGKLEVGDWVAADRGLGVVVLLFTYAATYHSAFAFLGAAGFTYAHGIGFFLAGFLWLVISGVIVYVLGTKLWLVGKRYGYVTPSEVLADFYDSEALGLLVSAVMILFTFPYVAVQLIGSGIIFETATDGLVSFELGALFLLVVGVIYVWLGGMRSIAWTDTVQGVFMIAAIWIAGWLFVFTAYRGPRDFWTALAAEAPAHLALPGPADLLAWEFYLSFAVVIGIGVALAPHIVLRYYSAASPRTLKWVAAGGTAYLVLFYVPLVFLALGAVVALPELANPDQAVPEVLFAFTPVWFASVVIAGAIAAAMATKDSQLHAVSTLIVRDWYEPYVESDPDERRRTRLLQALVLVLAAISRRRHPGAGHHRTGDARRLRRYRPGSARARWGVLLAAGVRERRHRRPPRGRGGRRRPGVRGRRPPGRDARVPGRLLRSARERDTLRRRQPARGPRPRREPREDTGLRPLRRAEGVGGRRVAAGG